MPIPASPVVLPSTDEALLHSTRYSFHCKIRRPKWVPRGSVPALITVKMHPFVWNEVSKSLIGLPGFGMQAMAFFIVAVPNTEEVPMSTESNEAF